MGISIHGAGGGGSAGVGMLKSTMTLTNDQIKALPTTAIEMIAAPGAGNYILPHLAVMMFSGNAAYTNINAAAYFFLGWPDLYGPLALLYEGSANAKVSGLLGGGQKMSIQVPYQTIDGDLTVAPNWEPVLGVNIPLTIFFDNNGGGNLTGGTALNTLKFTLYYTVEAVT